MVPCVHPIDARLEYLAGPGPTFCKIYVIMNPSAALDLLINLAPLGSTGVLYDPRYDLDILGVPLLVHATVEATVILLLS